MNEEEASGNSFSIPASPARQRPSPHHTTYCAIEPSSDSLIGEGELRRAFEQIANSIHLDDDDEQLQHDCSINGKYIVPLIGYGNNPKISILGKTAAPEVRDPRLTNSPSISRAYLTPKSSPNTGKISSLTLQRN